VPPIAPAPHGYRCLTTFRVTIAPPSDCAFGERTNPMAVASAPARAGALAVLLDELGIDRADAIGYSGGATSALQLALRHPDRPRRSCDTRGMTVLAGLFLLGHGLVHLAVWATPYDPVKSPFDPKHSWILEGVGIRSARPLLRAVAVVCALAFAIAGVAVLADVEWGANVAAGAAIASIVLSVVTFNRWLLINLALNVAIIVIAVG
jgi:pimeloyl-ACP methyl ester carboxylesterase